MAAKAKANFLVILCSVWVLFVFFYFSPTQTPAIGGQEIRIEAKVVEQPDVRQNSTVLIVKNEQINSRIRVTTKTNLNYAYGDILSIGGTIKTPENFSDDFNWKAYLAKEGIYYVIQNAQIEKLNTPHFNPRAYLGSVKNKFSKGIDAALLPPASSLYKAMLLRDRAEITDEQNTQFQNSGLSHILAISGLHIAIITVILYFIFLRAGLWRRHASYLALFVLSLYILMVGAPASAVRAGVMAAVVVLAETFGRPKASWRALLYAATIMLAFNPLLLRYDIGFQLSFLAVLGIILLYERIQKFFIKAQKRVVQLVSGKGVTRDMPVATYFEQSRFGLTSVLAVTFSAQALTFPLIIYHFGVFSLWSPITNLLVLPVMVVALPAGIIAGIAGAAGFLPAIFASPAWLFSQHIWWVVNLFGS